MTGRTGLELRGVEVPFGEGPGLRDIHLSIRAGERIALVGASGAGKTTLLRAIAGLIEPTAGSIEIDGEDLRGRPVGRRKIGYLHQTPLLFPHMTVGENVAFPLRVRGVDPTSIRRRVEAMLARVQLVDYGARSPEALSGGQIHRTALARALIAEPRVLLLDEPLASLDPALRSEVREAILGVRPVGTDGGHSGDAETVSMLFVTHDLEEAATVGERIAVLLEGRLAQVDSPERLFSGPRTLDVSRFLGITNEIFGRLRDGRFESVLGPIERRFEGPDGPAVVVVPASAICIEAAPESTGSPEERSARGTIVPRGTLRSVVHSPSGSRGRVAFNGHILEGILDRTRSISGVGAFVSVRIDPLDLILFPHVLFPDPADVGPDRSHASEPKSPI